MITLEKLKNYGANTDEGLARCMNNEAFYLKLVNKSLQDDKFDDLHAALETKNYDEAFNVAHAIKGVAGNLALTPLYDEISDMTEHLRQKEDMDYEPLFTKAREKFQSLVDLSAD